MAPPLLKTDNAVSTATYFVTIDLHAHAQTKPITGIFVPDHYRVTRPATADIILWLMGHHSTAGYPPTLTIDQYWVNYPHFRFREFVNAGGKNVILVAPSLGPSSETGKLTGKDGLSWFLDQVLESLEAYGPFQTFPSLGNLIIACHSGGGWPMRQIANSSQTYVTNIKQLWGFDCLYNRGDEQAWMTWAQQNGKKMLFIRYGDGGTAAKSINLQTMAVNQSNIDVDGKTYTHHNDVPKTYWYDFLSSASFLLNT
jgi:hypothetical protein